jgi:CRISPR-associated protein Csb2
VQFEKPVVGPVLLGAGRYHGLGLLRPFRGWGPR